MGIQKKESIATPEQIQEWKEKHGGVFEITVEGKICYLRKPDLKVLSAATVLGQKDPMAYNRTILTNCWLAGDEEIKSNDDYFLGVSSKLSDIIEIKEAEVKKL